MDHFETFRQRKDGTLLDISLTISPMRDRLGRIIGASKIARDITERKRMDTAIRRTNRALEQFSFSASHLQEPCGISGFTVNSWDQFRDKLDGDALEWLGHLRTGATRMEVLVRDLLAYKRVGNVEPPQEAVDANAVLAEALESLGGTVAESGAVVTSDKLPWVRYGCIVPTCNMYFKIWSATQ